MMTWFPVLLDELLSQPMRLEEMGIVSTAALRSAANQYRHRDQGELRVALFYTYQAERWLRTGTHKSAIQSRNSAASITQRKLVNVL
jgi:hypothetical protein